MVDGLLDRASCGGMPPEAMVYLSGTVSDNRRGDVVCKR